MEILLTLPENFARYLTRHKKLFPGITAGYSDPRDKKLGSGGGTVYALWQHGLAPSNPYKTSEKLGTHVHQDFTDNSNRRIIIHSDGQSRRLPAYATNGKSLIPFPVFRWGRGQRIDQTLLDIQVPVLQKILDRAPKGLNTLVASGDALVWTDLVMPEIPQADVVCAGIWAQPEAAVKHGVFVCQRSDPSRLQYMLQKPSLEELQGIAGDSLYLLDSGIWLLSDRAVEFLFNTTGWDSETQTFRNGVPEYFDLYSDLGRELGTDADQPGKLSVKILPVEHADFYHFGSNADLLRSTALLHNRVTDQREIWHKKIKPGPEIFVQNAVTHVTFNSAHAAIWIENSFIPESWTLRDHHILTGIPEKQWNIALPAGICLDFVPVGHRQWCARPYGFSDSFRGNVSDLSTLWMNKSFDSWFESHNFPQTVQTQFHGQDLFNCNLFPLLDEMELSGEFIQWLIKPEPNIEQEQAVHFRNFWKKSKRLSAHDIITACNVSRQVKQRLDNMQHSLAALAANNRQSIFYQLDLLHLAGEFSRSGIVLPEPPKQDGDVMKQIHDLMFRSACLNFKKMNREAVKYEQRAFESLREGMLEQTHSYRVNPVRNVCRDQIIWGRSPLRLDLAGGWTDTPPYCIMNGGKVVNLAVELNGQPPIQVYIRPTDKPLITVHSIDLGVSEVISTFDQISDTLKVGSAFSIPKAALMLAGFHPTFSGRQFKSLKDQLTDFGGGMDITLMVAVPKGSGLGTSSILAATLLGGLSEFCNLGWDRNLIAERTLMLEQLLTTGGGWQDQYGGIFEGVKLLESATGFSQMPAVRWAPDHLFTRAETRSLMLLYYTGITRVAKHILTDIVKGMFLNSSHHLDILAEMKQHAQKTYGTILNHDHSGLASAIRYSWDLNQQLDPGTNPPEVAGILTGIEEYMSACKLLGAGGGGYLLIIARDIPAAHQVRTYLGQHPPNPRARFVEWTLSATGLEITKS
ncbi:MAG: bifunctional fucokinase/fucose-1-phosphate guanylyltransferase [bacterium]